MRLAAFGNVGPDTRFANGLEGSRHRNIAPRVERFLTLAA